MGARTFVWIDQEDRIVRSILAGRAGLLVLLALSFVTLAGGCSQKEEPSDTGQSAAESYVVGLGEIMGQTQVRHAKLWFAGQAGNWPLAAYELDELKEGFDDAVKYHPLHKSAPEPLTAMIPEFMDLPLGELDTAIKAKSPDKFTTAFDHLTLGCNGCHKESDFGFNVVTRPAAPPFSNQIFAPQPSSTAGAR